MTNFNFEYKGTFLRYKDSNGNLLDLNGSQVDTDLEERTEQNETDISALQHYFDSISVKEDASGDVASFADGADGIPVKSLVVNIEPIQDLHGQSSPYPAGGGKNLFDGSAVSTSVPNNWEVSFANDALTIIRKNEFTGGIPKISFNFPAGTYVLSFASQTKTASISIYVDGSYNDVLRSGDTFAVADEHAYAIAFNADVGTPNIITKIQIEKGTTPSAFAPYSNICPISGRTVVNIWHDAEHDTSGEPILTIQLGKTVYGGTLNVTTGVLTVDRVFTTIDGDADWTEFSNGKFFVSNVTNMAAESTTKYISNQYLFSGRGTSASNQVNTDKRFYGQNGYSRIWVYDSQYESLDDFKSALNENPLQIVYPIENPVIVQLSPQTISTILGQNNIWADSGNVAVNYVADTKLYIDSQTAANANRETVKETIKETEKPDIIEEKEVINDNIEEEKEI